VFFKRLGCKDIIVRTNLGLFAIFSLILLMVIPVHADVTSLSLEKGFYTIDENFTIVGTQDGKEIVYVIIHDSNGNYKGMVSDPTTTQGEFSSIPRGVELFFDHEGLYNATGFTDSQRRENGTSILLEFDGNKLFEVPDVVLQLNGIADKSVEVEKTITFTASLVDNSIENPVYSLKNAPSGATIDSSTGKFVWTPSKSHGNIQDVSYNFDIIVKAGSQEDKENITITVKQAYVEPVKEPKPEPKETTPEPPVVSEELGIASFVDETKDPQSYVDRYNNEATYKKWFDENFPQYDSIYQAVGLETPKELAPFVDPNIDPQYYVDRYNKEDTYKKWFDETYPDITIYEAVGLDEEEIVEEEFGECGVGTDLVDGMCVIVDNSKGGGCLIATATYGSEMAPQVQLLREIRDNQLMSTDSGVSFMTGFNEFYYSFSPHIADMERESPVFKEMVKIGITPLLSTLSVMSYAETDSEVLGYGIGVILMNLGMYVAAPAIIIFKTRKYIKI
jgi:hypothetical protein